MENFCLTNFIWSISLFKINYLKIKKLQHHWKSDRTCCNFQFDISNFIELLNSRLFCLAFLLLPRFRHFVCRSHIVFYLLIQYDFGRKEWKIGLKFIVKKVQHKNLFFDCFHRRILFIYKYPHLLSNKKEHPQHQHHPLTHTHMLNLVPRLFFW